MFNGSSCDSDSCKQNGISTKKSNSNSFVINTTLEIRTGELHSVIMEKKTYTIQCIVEQNLDPIQMSGTINATVTLTVHPQQANIIMIGKCDNSILYGIEAGFSGSMHALRNVR